MKHTVVYQEKGVYAGWPANHGAWQWGNELLVGFMRGPYQRSEGMHNIAQLFEKMLARSLDGGRTWKIEKPNVDFEGNENRGLLEKIDLSKHIIRVCGSYLHGGEDSPKQGSFYLSEDRGHVWKGPYLFPFSWLGEDEHITARTRVLENSLYLSVADRKRWGSDYVVSVHVGELQKPTVVSHTMHRTVMPAVVRVSGTSLVAAVRCRGQGRSEGWIDAYRSKDEGRHWEIMSRVGVTGTHNGNPPSLLYTEGKLYCAYANRSLHRLEGKVSEDEGVTWSDPIVLRDEGKADIGYPQMLLREDQRRPLVIYYWADRENPQQHIVATEFEV